MYQDAIVEEIHKIREEYSRLFNHDLKAIFADLQKQQAESGREVVNLSRKRGITTRWSGRARDIGEDANNIVPPGKLLLERDPSLTNNLET